MLKRLVSVALAVVLALGVAAVVLYRPAQAVEITPMHVSEELVELVKDMEGFDAIPYWDYGQWTVGFGTSCPEEHRERYTAEGIPPDEAHALMMQQLAGFEENVNAFMIRNEVQLNQHQFDALVSLTYNVGSAVLYNKEGNVVKAILNGAEGNEFMYAIGQWSSAGGEFLYGLLKRRMVEAYIYLYGIYAPKPPESFCYVKYDANGGSNESKVQSYDTNMVAVPLSVPTREGYIFTGWYTAAEGGQKVSALDETTNGMTLYAHWEAGTPTTGTPTDPETGISVTVIGNLVSVRQKASDTANIVSHVYRGEKLNIIGLTEINGFLWGYCSKGWVNLEYTDYYEVTGTKRPDGTVPVQQVQVPIKVTVLSSSGVKVYSGPHTSYLQLGALSQGDSVEIVEVMTFCALLWGRYEGGWIRLNQRVLLHDETVLAHGFVATVEYSRLNVRSGPSMSYGILDQIKDGTKIEILAIQVVDGVSWGRFISGWVYLDGYTDYDPSKLPYYQNHSYGDWNVLTEATCSQPGQMRRNCQHCEHYELKQIPKTAHSLGDWYVSKKGDCVTVGKMSRDCKNCDYVETIDSTLGEHVMGDWYVSVSATCVAEGQERRDCKLCEHSETRTIGIGSHSFGEWVQTLAPGCETVGQEQRICKNCTHTEVREVAATGHSFGEWYEKIAPTAETEGEARRECANCDHYETKVLPVNPHVYGDWYVHTAPTCVTPGEERRNCSHCDQYESRPIAVTDHSYGQWSVSVAGTCVTAGQERRDCTVCDHFETRTGQLGEHSYGEWYVSAEATCVTPGQEKRQCQLCDHFETKETGLGGHSFGEWTQTVAPGCETAGQEQRPCKHCTHTEIREIAAVGHSLGEWFVSQAATCTAEGQERRKCSRCDFAETRVIEKLEHSYGEWFVSQAPTCTAEGQEQRKCTQCDHTQSRAIAMVAHSYGDWYVLIDPTIDLEGLQCRECVNCDAAQTEALPMLPSEEKVYATVTINFLNVRAEASTGAAKVGTLSKGSVVPLLEQKTVDGNLWGRIEFGWILLTDNATVQTVREAVATDDGEKTYATITYDGYMYLRPQAGVTTGHVGTVYEDVRLRIYETTVIGDVTWGRTAYGWIWLTGNTTLEIEPGVHKEHTYGQWYVSQPGTCVTVSQERRDCTQCDHFETREGQLGDHSYDDWAQTLAPGCETVGQEQRKCLHCGQVETRELAAKGHSMGEWFVSQAPTCTAEGQEQRKCAGCELVESRTIDKLAHSYGEWFVLQAATCTAEGQEQRKCTGCELVESRTIAKLDHSYGDWYVVTPPTTEQEGLQRRECTACGDTQTQTLPVVTTVEKVYATVIISSLNVRKETSTGATRVGTLKKGMIVELLEQKTVDGNLWGRIEFGWILITDCATLETVTESIRSDDGDKTYATVTYDGYLNIRPQAGVTSSNVGTVYEGVRLRIYETVVIENVTWGRTAFGWLWLTDNTSLETESGVHSEHTFGDWFVSQAATCTAEGQEQRKCTGCELVESRTIAKLDHSYGDWYVVTPPTTEQEGLQRRDCANCDAMQTQTLPALSTVEKVYATVTISFLNIRVETSTGAAKVGTLSKGSVVQLLEQKTVDGNLWGRIEFGWILITDCATLETVREAVEADDGEKTYATVTYDGYLYFRPQAGVTTSYVGTVYTGVRLRIYETTVIGDVTWGRTAFGWIWLTGNTTVEIAHNLGQWYVVTAPDCVTAGQERRDCQDCAYHESREISPVGHSFGQWYIYGAPDCENPGSQCRDCANCEYIDTQQIPALGHAFGQWYVTKEATTTQTGEERRDCSTCGQYETREVEKLPATVRVYGTVIGTDYLNIREGAGKSYDSIGKLLPGTRVEILEQKEVDGVLWGRIEAGWIWITGYVELKVESVTLVTGTKLYATVTAASLSVHQGTGSDTTNLGTVKQGDVLRILEIRTVDGAEWGRTETGWICLTGAVTLNAETGDVVEGTSFRLYATVTCRVLNIRADADAGATYLGELKRNEVVEILQFKTVNGVIWGRTASGWICLSNNTTLATTSESQA